MQAIAQAKSLLQLMYQMQNEGPLLKYIMKVILPDLTVGSCGCILRSRTERQAASTIKRSKTNIL